MARVEGYSETIKNLARVYVRATSKRDNLGMASFIGISRPTLIKYRKQHADLEEAIKFPTKDIDLAVLDIIIETILDKGYKDQDIVVVDGKPKKSVKFTKLRLKELEDLKKTGWTSGIDYLFQNKKTLTEKEARDQMDIFRQFNCKEITAEEADAMYKARGWEVPESIHNELDEKKALNLSRFESEKSKMNTERLKRINELSEMKNSGKLTDDQYQAFVDEEM